MANTPIFNASSQTLDQNPNGSFPDLSGALFDWFQPMQFATVVKTVGLDFLVTEIKTTIDFEGVWQPFTARDLMMKPEGQRRWRWFTCHAFPSLELQPDQLITYLGIQYRVMEKLNWKLNGYVEYHLVQDYTGSGPTEGA